MASKVFEYGLWVIRTTFMVLLHFCFNLESLIHSHHLQNLSFCVLCKLKKARFGTKWRWINYHFHFQFSIFRAAGATHGILNVYLNHVLALVKCKWLLQLCDYRHCWQICLPSWPWKTLHLNQNAFGKLPHKHAKS